MKLPCEGILNLFKQVCWWSIRHHIPPKDEDGPLDVIGYPKGIVLPDSSSQPVIEAKILVYQEASHLFFLRLKTDMRSLQENGSSSDGFLLILQIQKWLLKNLPAWNLFLHRCSGIRQRLPNVCEIARPDQPARRIQFRPMTRTHYPAG